MDFFREQSVFLLLLGAIFFVPGWFFLSAFFSRSRFMLLEWLVLAAASSISILIFLMIVLDRLRVSFSVASLGISLVTLCVFFCSIAWWKRRSIGSPSDEASFLPSRFSKTESLAVVLLFLLTVFIKTVYLFDAGVPSSTDLGHHMYWAKLMASTGSVPTYAERDIEEHDGAYELADPKPIADFIVGEHLPFAALAILSGKDFISSFPVTVLFLVNLLSILALFVLVWRFFYRRVASDSRHFTWVALAALLLIGPIYALSSPQAKFVSGGVIGNTFGNFFLPVLFLVYYRAFRNRDSNFLTLGFFLTFGLVYIHHLSTLVFLFSAIGALGTFCAFHIRQIPALIRQWSDFVFRPAPIIFALIAIAFFFLIYTPSYAQPTAINTAVGAPSKETRTGLSLLQLADSTGAGRLGIGLAGIFALLWLRSRSRHTNAFLVGWSAILLIMTLRPDLVFINIPSNRISTYAIFPLTLLAAWLVAHLFRKHASTPPTNQAFPRTLSGLLLAVFVVATISGGYFDNAQSILRNSKDQETLETFAISKYFATKTDDTDLILKDHNYITADSWMKLFFLRGYTYPLSRGYFKRYEDETKPREQCTLWMISVPNTPRGTKCFDDTGTNVVVVNPHYDSAQFRKSPDFSLVYASDSTAAYYRTTH